MKANRYVIRRQDRRVAIAFVEQRLNAEPQWIEGDKQRQLVAKQDYLDNIVDPDAINAWCAKWLNDAQWEQLRQAISTARDLQEKIRQASPLKTISLSDRAWQILIDLAQKDNTTLSNVIINHLGNAHFAACKQAEIDYNLSGANQDRISLNA
ncbi:MAG: hypothetical protein RQ714_08900 [Nitrosomonas sp.]|nr:hypothetical protein [Nitrosomonas sp.]